MRCFTRAIRHSTVASFGAGSSCCSGHTFDAKLVQSQERNQGEGPSAQFSLVCFQKL
jgi:hypothetical protein